MKTTLNLSIFILFFIAQNSLQNQTTDLIEKYCQAYNGKTFLLFQTDTEINWDIKKDVSQTPLGSGSFGTVYSASFPFELLSPTDYGYIDQSKLSLDKTATVAIKFTKFSYQSAMEIMVLRKLSTKKTGAAYFGCQYADKQLMIVQQRFDMDLDQNSFRLYAAKIGLLRRLYFYQSLFEQTIMLFKIGFVNNDIKTTNMMFDSKNEKVVIIDFGLAQHKHESLIYAGTAAFMSPGKFNLDKVPRTAELIEDLFSLVISIASIEDPHGINNVYKNNKVFGYAYQCEETKSSWCMDLIKTNVRKMISGSTQFEPAKIRTDASGENIIYARAEFTLTSTNFLGLIDAILEYDKYTISPDTILVIIKNEIRRLTKLSADDGDIDEGVIQPVPAKFYQMLSNPDRVDDAKFGKKRVVPVNHSSFWDFKWLFG